MPIWSPPQSLRMGANKGTSVKNDAELSERMSCAEGLRQKMKAMRWEKRNVAVQTQPISRWLFFILTCLGGLKTFILGLISVHSSNQLSKTLCDYSWESKMVRTLICTTTKSGTGPCTHWLTSEGVKLVLPNNTEVEQNANTGSRICNKGADKPEDRLPAKWKRLATWKLCSDFVSCHVSRRLADSERCERLLLELFILWDPHHSCNLADVLENNDTFQC